MIGRAIGELACLIPNETRRTSLINLRLCLPELGTKERHRLLRHSLIETGKLIAEAGIVWRTPRLRFLRLIKHTDNQHLLDDALDGGKSVILALPHLGNWEVVSLYCSLLHPVTSLYRPPRLTGLDPLIKVARQRFGANLVATDTTGVRELYRALGENRVVLILPDQDPRGGNGRFVRFFSQQAYTMTLLPRLAQKTKAQIIFSFAERLPRGQGFSVHFFQGPAVEDQISTEDLLQLINDGIEDCIRLCPHQYQWGYQRFRTRPPGAPPIY